MQIELQYIIFGSQFSDSKSEDSFVLKRNLLYTFIIRN